MTPNPMLEKLLNKCEPGSRVLMHMVPTRIIRIVQLAEDGKTFRVEQLVEHAGFGSLDPKGEWRTLTTHHSEQPGEALGVAFQAAARAQADLIYKLKQRFAARQPGIVR